MMKLSAEKRFLRQTLCSGSVVKSLTDDQVSSHTLHTSSVLTARANLAQSYCGFQLGWAPNKPLTKPI